MSRSVFSGRLGDEKKVIARYLDPEHTLERFVPTKLIAASFAEEYINKNKSRPLMTYCPGLVNTDAFHLMLIETKAYKKEYSKIKD